MAQQKREQAEAPHGDAPEQEQEHHGAHESPPPKQHATRAGALIGVLVALLGFAFVVQIRSNERNGPYAAARQQDLIRILGDLDSRESRLRTQIGTLQQTQTQLQSGSSGDATALKSAQQRQRQLGILIGTVPATGPGLVITIADRNQPLKASTMLDAVEELRGAGAEAMQISGDRQGAKRIGVSSYFLDASGGITVDGTLLTSPYSITVIGNSATLSAAMNIPGGVKDTVDNGGVISIAEKKTVDISATRTPAQPKYAKPTQ